MQDGGSLLVVDTGHPRSWRSLRRAVAALGLTLGHVEAVALTHGHFDHMGFARRAREELGVPVYAHPRELPLARDPWRYEHERSRIPYLLRHPGFDRAFFAMATMGALWVKGVDDATTFEHSQVLDLPGRPEVVFTPGHTHGHCALYLRERGVLLAGDAFVTWNPYTASAGPQIVSGAATADSGEALRSLDRLSATGAEIVLTGHGDPWTDGVESAVEQARAAGPS